MDSGSTNVNLVGHTFRALRHRNFRLFFIGQTISWIGTWMQQLALGWLAYNLSHSPFVLGYVTFASQAPTFFLSPFTGAVADRVNRRKLVIATQALAMVQAFVLSALTLTHTIEIWHMVALGIFLGVVNSFDMPARQSFMVQMVDNKEDLPNAIALNSSLVNGARLIGPTIAGFLISWFGEGVCFFLNGVTYLAVIGALIAMKVPVATTQRRMETDVYSHLKEGWKYVFGFAPTRALIVLLAVTSLCGSPYTTLMPVFAKETFHGGASDLGFLAGATGIGALTGAIALASRRAVPGLGMWILVATLMFGGGLMLFSLLHAFWLAMIVLVFVGFGFMVQLAATNTILQTITDDDKRGRVMSLYTMAFMVTPFGGLAFGALATKIGSGHAVLIGGLLTLVAGVMFGSQMKQLRAEVRQVYMRKGIMPRPAE